MFPTCQMVLWKAQAWRIYFSSIILTSGRCSLTFTKFYSCTVMWRDTTHRPKILSYILLPWAILELGTLWKYAYKINTILALQLTCWVVSGFDDVTKTVINTHKKLVIHKKTMKIKYTCKSPDWWWSKMQDILSSAMYRNQRSLQCRCSVVIAHESFFTINYIVKGIVKKKLSFPTKIWYEVYQYSMEN